MLNIITNRTLEALIRRLHLSKEYHLSLIITLKIINISGHKAAASKFYILKSFN